MYQQYSVRPVMHQSFVTTAPCRPPPPPLPTGNSGDNDVSSITALLKALHCGDLLRVIALPFMRVNFTGYICAISQKVTAPHISPAIPVDGGGGGGGRGYKWLLHYEDIIWAVSWQTQQNDFAPSEDSDQPGYMPSLIRVFAVRSMGS